MGNSATTADAPLSASVWIVEDEVFEANRFKRLLVQLGHDDASLVVLRSLHEAREYLASKPQQAPVLALVDLSLPDGDGRALIAQLRAQYQVLLIVVTSAWTSYDEVFEALSMGAQGYIFKERDEWEITLALRHMLQGESVIEPIIAHRMLAQFSLADALGMPIDGRSQLSALERSVLLKVTEGLCNREIAQQLQLDRGCVNACIQSACRKLGAVVPI